MCCFQPAESVGCVPDLHHPVGLPLWLFDFLFVTFSTMSQGVSALFHFYDMMQKHILALWCRVISQRVILFVKNQHSYMRLVSLLPFHLYSAVTGDMRATQAVLTTGGNNILFAQYICCNRYTGSEGCSVQYYHPVSRPFFCPLHNTALMAPFGPLPSQPVGGKVYSPYCIETNRSFYILVQKVSIRTYPNHRCDLHVTVCVYVPSLDVRSSRGQVDRSKITFLDSHYLWCVNTYRT